MPRMACDSEYSSSTSRAAEVACSRVSATTMATG